MVWLRQLSGKIVPEGGPDTRKASMSNWRTLQLHLGLAIIALCLTASAQNAEQPISVLVQPEAEYLGAVRVSITNNSKHKVWFESCPDAYTVELTDSNGRIVPYKLPQPPAGPTWECGRNIIYTILPGKTWTTQVAINEKFDLKAGTYSLRVRWHFPWNVRKTDQGADWDTLTVSSNTISLTISH
jgi:hypothetical protein